MAPQSRTSTALALVIAVFVATTALASCSRPERPGPKKASRNQADTVARGTLISSELIGRKSLRDVAIQYRDNGIGRQPRCGVALYRIVYSTIDPNGGVTTASGALAIPDDTSETLPVLSYQHGTVANRHSVASEFGFDLASLLFGGDGYVVAIPDYLGLGSSPGLHPYVHAASLASAIVDMLRATRGFCHDKGVALNGQLYLLGYSEGGYATLAAQKEIETNRRPEFTITASAPMAGPYDMSGTMREFFMTDAHYDDPFYLPYVVLAYNSVYHLADSLGQIFAAPYAARLPGLFDGEHEGFKINDALPPVPKDVFNPAFLASFRSDSTNPLRRALADNDLTNWTPRVPTHLYHCTSDDRVPYRNALIAYQRFHDRGAAQVKLVTLDNGGHMTCAMPCILAGWKWFDEIRKK